MDSRKIVFVLIVSLLGFYGFAFMAKPVYASPKSLYVLADLNGTPNPVQAYDIQPAPNYLVYQWTQYVTDWGGGGVGICIDSQSQALFITYEFTNTIQLVNATTFADLGTTTAPGASDLAGIVYDHDKGLVYTVDRHTGNLYVYQWDAATHILTLQTQVDLTAHVSDAYGIALDEINDILYVSDGYNDNFDYYDTDTWTHLGTKTTTHTVAGIAVDARNGFVYTGGWYYDDGLYKYDLATDIETGVLNGTVYAYVNGIAVDPDQNPSLVYVTTYGTSSTGYRDVLMVFDSDLNELWKSGDIGNPTGLTIPRGEISYNPLGLIKSDNPDPVLPGGTITYTISFDNSLNNFDVHNVMLNDSLPVQTDFVSATGGGTYDPVKHKVTWNIGTLVAGAPTSSVTLVVTVKSNTVPGTVLDNFATIASDETPPTTQHEYTTVGMAPTIESCDSIGTKKDSFIPSETVHANGSGYLPSKTYDLYVVPDTTWTGGMTIPGTPISVSSDSSGVVQPTPVWSPPLTIGTYDIVVDVDGDGVYDAGMDALDDNDIQVTAGFLVIPEFLIGAILGLAGCFAAFGVFRVSKRRHL